MKYFLLMAALMAICSVTVADDRADALAAKTLATTAKTDAGEAEDLGNEDWSLFLVTLEAWQECGHSPACEGCFSDSLEYLIDEGIGDSSRTAANGYVTNAAGDMTSGNIKFGIPAYVLAKGFYATSASSYNYAASVFGQVYQRYTWASEHLQNMIDCDGCAEGGGE